MRYFVREKILELIPTFHEAIDYIFKEPKDQNIFLIEDLRTGINSIRHTFNNSFSAETSSKYDKLFAGFEQNLNRIQVNITNQKNVTKETKELKKLLDQLKEQLNVEPEVKLEVLFMPYKYSMWDSLESIWLTAKDDPRCHARVMPIPYYERDENGLLSDFHYEIEEFLVNDIPVVSYKEYDYTVIRPDIIYFHNPYDGENRVTSVSPEFYTDKLKHYTDMLVYVPYYVSGVDTSQNIRTGLFPGEKTAHKIISSSKQLTDSYIKLGVESDKILTLGSPKIDYMYKLSNEKKLPKNWKERINGKKVILLNSTIGRLLRNQNYLHLLRDTINKIMNHNDIVLIWRPHPLLESTIKSMRPHLWEEYQVIKEMIKKEAILDTFQDFSFAVSISDGMISDHSSLARTYIATEKPLLFLEKSSSEETKTMTMNFYGSYFVEDGYTIEQFIRNILLNEDPGKELRLRKFKSTLENPDGTAGEKIHETIIKIKNEMVPGN